jgi:hypothetical protein
MEKKTDETNIGVPASIAEFPAELRNLMVKIMTKGAINSQDNGDMFNLLLTKRELVSSYLKNLNLKVEINAEKGMAFIHNYRRDDEFIEGEENSQDETEADIRGPEDLFLISSRKLSVYDTIVILVLRKFYHERANAQGESFVVIDVERIKTMLVPYLREIVSTTRDGKNLNGIMSRLQEKQLVRKLSGEDEDRYQILPLIHYVINVKAMETMLEQYRALAESYGIDASDKNDADTEDKQSS